MLVPVIRGHGVEDHLHLVESLPVLRQHPLPDTGSVAAGTGLGEAPVDGAIAGEGRAERGIEQSALSPRFDLGQIGDRRTHISRGRDHPHPAGPLGDEQVSARQRLNRPGVLEPARHDGNVERDVGLVLTGPGLAGKGWLLIGGVRLPGLQRLAGGGAADRGVPAPAGLART